MAQSARWADADEHPGVRRMGRGPGVRAASASSIQVDFRYQGVRCREKLSLPPTPKNLRYAARLKARIEHEIALGQFDYAQHFPASPRAKKLARALGVNDRRVRQWMADERPIPPGIWADIAGLLRQRQREGLALLRELDSAHEKTHAC